MKRPWLLALGLTLLLSYVAESGATAEILGQGAASRAPGSSNSNGGSLGPAHRLATPAESAPRGPLGYADDFSALSAEAREFDHRPEGVFSYCARNTAVYECLSYGPEGAVRKERRKAVLHGTAFAYRRQGAETFLLTNDHVASWPPVTDPQHVVSGVPSGCKRMSESLSLVDDERDAYDRDDVPLTRVVTDPQLDVAIVKTQVELHVMPWRIGHSAELRERDVVEVRGFPLGAFRATNVGKVISALDHDDFGDWDHDDFVVDALLSSGNSGSPVLAVSPTTGEYELVGIYHAGYTEGSALNVVVGIDQVRDMMSTFKRTPHDHADEPLALTPRDRARLWAELGAGREMFFPFGGLVGLARGLSDGSVLFAVFPKTFPFTSEPTFVIEDSPPDGGMAGPFGVPGRVWFGKAEGVASFERAALDAETQGQIADLLEALRTDACAHAEYRVAARQESASPESSRQISRMAKGLNRVAARRADLNQLLGDLSDRLVATAGSKTTAFADLTIKPDVVDLPGGSGGLSGGAPVDGAVSRLDLLPHSAM